MADQPEAEPVFVDSSGLRRRVIRVLGAVVAAASLTYLVLIGAGALTDAPRPVSSTCSPPPGVGNVHSADPGKDNR